MRSLLMIVVFFLSGCIAGKAGYQLVDTEKAFAAAKEAGAEELAVYEYTLAQAYRSKAWEEAGYSAYGPAEELAKKAVEYALKATEVAQNSERPLPIGVVPTAAEPSVPEGLDLEASGGADAPMEELPVGIDSEESNSNAIPLEEPPDEAVEEQEKPVNEEALELDTEEGLDWLFDELEGGE